MNTKNQVWGYFGLQGIGNQDQHVPYPLAAHNLPNIGTDTQQEHNIYDEVLPDMISKIAEV